MEIETFEGSWYLIEGVMDSTKEWLFHTKEWREKYQIIEMIDEAIKELESWKDAVKKDDALTNGGEK